MSDHRHTTRDLASNLRFHQVYHWLVEHGYFPESYVLPPCFRVKARPKYPRLFSKVSGKGKTFQLVERELVSLAFPKSELADNYFGVLHPEIHNDVAYHIARNWKTIVKALGKLCTSQS